jgi:hypothetical protein
MGIAVIGALLLLGAICWFVSKALADGDERMARAPVIAKKSADAPKVERADV